MDNKETCRNCNKEFEYLDIYPHTEGFCSVACHEKWKKSYDNYVDPYNAYH